MYLIDILFPSFAESSVIQLCDGNLTHQIGEDQEGVIFSPSFYQEIISHTKDNKSGTISQFCSTILTPTHGQFLHFDLIPLSMESTHSISFNQLPPTTAEHGSTSQSCPSTTDDWELLKTTQFDNVTLSLQNHQTNQTAEPLDIFIITYTGKNSDIFVSILRKIK